MDRREAVDFRVQVTSAEGRANLLLNDYASAEAGFRRALLLGRKQGLGFSDAVFPAFQILSHYYLGQLYERTGKRDQAINEYQEFLSNFEISHSHLRQVGEARTSLKRLMQ